MGKLISQSPLAMEVAGLPLAIGTLCECLAEDGSRIVGSVTGFRENYTIIMPVSAMQHCLPGAPVYALDERFSFPVGTALLGRIIDALGNPLDNKGLIETNEALHSLEAIQHPLSRQPIREVFDIGVRAINALLTMGKGQKMGVFAGSGVGKSSLLAMMTRFCKADIAVLALIGERGREVQEFITEGLGDALPRSVVLVAPADEPPLKRVLAARYATAIARYFRNQGKNVLLVMDSVTRFAHATREIALYNGEPAAVKGYPPSVFSALSTLIEQSGNGDKGSLTSIYSVLMDGDDENDPIVDTARAILDGHIILSRKLAGQGIYPAIDVQSSVSRVMSALLPPEKRIFSQRFKEAMALCESNRDLVQTGMYQRGLDSRVDEALDKEQAMYAFIQQESTKSASFAESMKKLQLLWESTDANAR